MSLNYANDTTLPKETRKLLGTPCPPSGLGDLIYGMNHCNNDYLDWMIVAFLAEYGDGATVRDLDQEIGAGGPRCSGACKRLERLGLVLPVKRVDPPVFDFNKPARGYRLRRRGERSAAPKKGPEDRTAKDLADRGYKLVSIGRGWDGGLSRRDLEYKLVSVDARDGRWMALISGPPRRSVARLRLASGDGVKRRPMPTVFPSRVAAAHAALDALGL